MLIAKFTTIKPEMAHSRTYEDFYKFLGAKPARLGIVSRMYPWLTASFLTEGLMNIFYNEKSPSKFQSINSLMFEWEIDVNFIKRVEFASVPEGDGAYGTDITMAFTERYFEKYDVFVIELSRQQCIVKEAPIRKADNYWEYTVQLIDADYSSLLDTTACQPGMRTRFLTNYQPEYSEEGYTKYQSNIEKHRNWIAEHRNDISFSARYSIMEDVFVSIATGKDAASLSETIFKMNKKEQDVLVSFLEARNNALMFGKTTMDINGKSTVTDPHTGRPIIAGDGILAQVERFASKYQFAKLSISVFNTAITTMNEKAQNPTGNDYVFICNEKMYAQVQTVLSNYLKDWKTVGTFLFSKKAGGNVSVGATYNSYEFMGNTVTFQVDRTLSREYPEKAYALVIDLTADKTTAMPAIQMFTLKNAEFTTSKYPGVGGLDGTTSGIVSSPVAGSKLINTGYAGVGVFAPYRSFILEQI